MGWSLDLDLGVMTSGQSQDLGFRVGSRHTAIVENLSLSSLQLKTDSFPVLCI